MRTLRLVVDFEYDAERTHSGSRDTEARDWFLNEVLMNEPLVLHSQEIGDAIGTVHVRSYEVARCEGCGLPLDTEASMCEPSYCAVKDQP